MNAWFIKNGLVRIVSKNKVNFFMGKGKIKSLTNYGNGPYLAVIYVFGCKAG